MYDNTYQDILRRMRTDMTDLDLERYGFTPDDIMKYSELADVNSIYDILPHDRSSKILLVESEYSKGHWVALLRYDNTIEMMDSYGIHPDEELSFVSNLQKTLLGQDKKYLTHLLKKLPKAVNKVYNKKKLQKIVNGSATCGRYVVLRIVLMRDFGLNLKEFQDFLSHWTAHTDLSSDELVSAMVI